MIEGHSEYGASSANRFINCTGSVKLAAKVKELFGEQETSVYASEGTAAHTLAAWCLDYQDRPYFEPWEYTGTKIEADGYTFTVDDNMAGAVGVFVELVRGHLQDYMDDLRWDYELFVEHKFHHPGIHEKFYGTSDATLVMPSYKMLRVYDYKHGKGVPVSVVENDQLLYYALGIWYELPANVRGVIERIELYIVQPRAGMDEPVQMWATTPAYLLEWLQRRLLPAIEISESGLGELNAGPWCQFCPVKQANACPELLAGAQEAADASGVVDVKQLGNDELAAWMEKRDAVKMFLTEIERETYRRLNASVEIPGWKLVKKRANRVWKEGAEKALYAQYGSEIWEKKMLSPAQVEELPGGEELTKKFAKPPDTGLTVAPASSKKKAEKPRTAADAFASVPASD